MDRVAPNEEPDKLRNYQIDGAKFLYEAGRAINGDEAGLGKTVETLFAQDTGPYEQKPTLIVCPKVAMGVWEREIKKWLNRESMIFVGTPKQRDKLTEVYLNTPAPERPKFVITTYPTVGDVYRWQKRWNTIICDEAHNMRNRKSVAFNNVRKFAYVRLYLLTASPIVNHIMDMWPLLYLIDKRRFGSYWRFAEEHCHVIKGDFGFEVSGPKNPKVTRATLAPYILRRTKKQVLPELPLKTRKPIPIEMTPTQERIYNEIALEKLTQLESGEIIVAPNKMSELTRLRQLLVTPSLFGGPNKSAALDALRESAIQDYYERLSVCIYCPFAKAFEFIEASLEDTGCEEIYEIKGGLTYRQIAWTEEAFRASKKKRAIVISLLSATSFSIETCTQGYFLGSHWNSEINIQAEDRMHRMTTKEPVMCNYFQHKGTVDEHVLDIVNRKLTWSRLILNPELLLFGSKGRPT